MQSYECVATAGWYRISRSHSCVIRLCNFYAQLRNFYLFWLRNIWRVLTPKVTNAIPSPISVPGSVTTKPAAPAASSTVSTAMQVSARVANVLGMSLPSCLLLSRISGAYPVPTQTARRFPLFLGRLDLGARNWKCIYLRIIPDFDSQIDEEMFPDLCKSPIVKELSQWVPSYISIKESGLISQVGSYVHCS